MQSVGLQVPPDCSNLRPNRSQAFLGCYQVVLPRNASPAVVMIARQTSPAWSGQDHGAIGDDGDDAGLLHLHHLYFAAAELVDDVDAGACSMDKNGCIHYDPSFLPRARLRTSTHSLVVNNIKAMASVIVLTRRGFRLQENSARVRGTLAAMAG